MFAFDDWSDRISRGAVDRIQKSLNSLVILGAWTLWKHPLCVFYGASPSVARALLLAMKDLHLWGLARRKVLIFSWPLCRREVDHPLYIICGRGRFFVV